MYLNARKAKFLKDCGLQLIERSETWLDSLDREYWGLPDLDEVDWIVCCARRGTIHVGVNPHWHFTHTDRISVSASKRVKNNHSFRTSVTQTLNEIDKLKRERANNQKEQHLREIKKAGNEYAVD